MRLSRFARALAALALTFSVSAEASTRKHVASAPGDPERVAEAYVTDGLVDPTSAYSATLRPPGPRRAP
jgi:hypothetical protein